MLAAVVREASSKGCGGLAAALEALDERARGGAPRLPARALLGLVSDSLAGAATTCPAPAARQWLAAMRGTVVELARAELLSAEPDAGLAVLEAAPRDVPAVLIRCAELLERAGRPLDARRRLSRALEIEDEPATRVALARMELAGGDARRALDLLPPAHLAATQSAAQVRAAALAWLGREAEAVREVAIAPLDQRAAVARAAAGASRNPSRLAAAAKASPETLWSLAERARHEHGPDASARLLQQAADLAPRDAALLEALAEDLSAAGEDERALAAWDRAAALAPVAQRPRLEPIALCVRIGRRREARRRAEVLAASARAIADADALARASVAASAAGDAALALHLAREALDARPGDGRLALGLAERLEQAGRTSEALSALARLFVCGAHSRPWHRHELAVRMGSLARERGGVVALEPLLRRAEECGTPPDPEDLVNTRATIFAQLRSVRP